MEELQRSICRCKKMFRVCGYLPDGAENRQQCVFCADRITADKVYEELKRNKDFEVVIMEDNDTKEAIKEFERRM